MNHQPITYGPMAEGDRTISSGTYPMSGWGWTCTCKASGFGYQTESEAEKWCQAHLDRDDGKLSWL